MINIEPKHLKYVQDILAKYPYKFYVFGSRASSKAKKFSDLDLCFFEAIPNHELLNIEEAFEESDLPYKVDLVDGNKCDPEFRKIIERNMIGLDYNNS